MEEAKHAHTGEESGAPAGPVRGPSSAGPAADPAERLRLALEAAGFGHWEWNVRTGRVTWSDRMEQIHELPAGTFDETFDAFLHGVHPEDRAPVQQTVAAALRGGGAYHVLYRLPERNAVTRWVEAHGHAFFDEAGQPIRMVGICMDVTERMQAETERAILLKREREARATAEAAESRTAFLAEASRLLSASLDYETTLRSVTGLIVPHLADWCVIDVVDAEGAFEMIAVSHVDPAKVRWAHELRRKYPVDPHAPHGTPRVVRTGEPEFVAEITDAMLVAVAADEEQLALLREIGYRSVIVVPLIAREHVLGALTLVWAESERHYTTAELRFAEELAGRVALAVDNARLFREAQEAQQRLRQLNETLEARVQERTTELTAANRELRRQAVERERAQRVLARTNMILEQRNRELQDFAYVASHDLQEPLRKISAFTDLLRADYRERLDGTALHYLERMQDAALRMTALIKDLLAFSRIATRGQPFAPTDLNEILADVLSDLEIALTESGAAIEADVLPTLEADATQMRQLFQNLIGNGLKFHRSGTAPVLCIRGRIEPGRAEAAAPEVCRIEVEDNGIGFEEKYLDRIFSPFQRLHGGATYPGTGMGLAICRRIAERHGGTITACSTPGEGSTFIVTLPARQENDHTA